MKNQKKLDKILESVKELVQDEIGALMGVDFLLTPVFNKLVSKEDYFSDLSGKKIFAKLSISGDIEGRGGLVVDVKDGIRLGGTLIMLPPAELDEVVRSEEYTDETEDSYGEIANIIAGSYTKVFEEMHPKNCRFVRKEQELISPAKIEIDSDEPIPDLWYYLVRSSMILDGLEMGELDVIIPAEPFGLESPVESKKTVEEESQNQPQEKDEKVEPVPSPVAEQPQETIKKAPIVDTGKQKKLIDRTLNSLEGKVGEEVGELLGADFKLTSLGNQFISKEDYFSELSGKKIFAKLSITGDIEGRGGLIIDVKDGIRLGGTLIMLPPAELDEVVRSEEYTDETEDSYGEIANIIAGSYTKVFEEMYPKNCRFVRKEQELISPTKIEVNSDEPIPDLWYYLVRSSMKLDGLEMGKLDVIIPTEPFGLGSPVPVESNEAVEEDSHNQPQVKDEKVESVTAAEQRQDATEKAPSIDVTKQKKLVDKLLKSCQSTVGEEVGALLGIDVKLNNQSNKIVTKEDFFLEEATGKQVLAHMDVVGEIESESYLFVGIKDAIRIGSILIMLPPSELEASVNEEDFSTDTEDAYGEITNIIAGVYTTVFQDQYPQSIRFVKSDLELVSPMKVDISSDDVIQDQFYYLSSCDLEIDGKETGKITMLFPLALFQLEPLSQESSTLESVGGVAEGTGITQQGKGVIAEPEISAITDSETSGAGRATGDIDILLIEDNKEEAEKIQRELANSGILSKRIEFSDNINYHISPGLKLIFIIMQEVNEQAYGITIKVNSLCQTPIIAAGPEWTRTKVIKAVKYGVNDILLTPAMDSDIKEKVENNIIKLAA